MWLQKATWKSLHGDDLLDCTHQDSFRWPLLDEIKILHEPAIQ